MAGGAAVGRAAAGMSAKQREAYQEHQRFHVANQGYGQAGPSGAEMPTSPIHSAPVTVHTNSGIMNEPEPNFGSEIPPT